MSRYSQDEWIIIIKEAYASPRNIAKTCFKYDTSRDSLLYWANKLSKENLLPTPLIWLIEAKNASRNPLKSPEL